MQNPPAIPEYAWWLTGFVAAAVILIDIYLTFNGQKGDTFSEVIQNWARRRMPVVIGISFALGLLAGHWFW